MAQISTATKQSFNYTINTFDNDNYMFGEKSLEDRIKGISIQDEHNESSDIVVEEDKNMLIDPSIITTTTAKKEEKLFKSMTKSIPIAKWEGVVASVDLENKKFTGELKDILNNDKDLIIAEFDFDDVEESKHALIKKNSIFYWNIYDENTHRGLNRGTNYIYFREILPIWKSYNFDQPSSSTIEVHNAIFNDD